MHVHIFLSSYSLIILLSLISLCVRYFLYKVSSTSSPFSVVGVDVSGWAKSDNPTPISLCFHDFNLVSMAVKVYMSLWYIDLLPGTAVYCDGLLICTSEFWTVTCSFSAPLPVDLKHSAYWCCSNESDLYFCRELFHSLTH